MQVSFILAIAINLTTSWLPPLQDTPPITPADLLEGFDFWDRNVANLPQAVNSEHEFFLTSDLRQLDILELLSFFFLPPLYIFLIYGVFFYKAFQDLKISSSLSQL